MSEKQHTQLEPGDEAVSIREVQNALGIHRRSVWRMIEAGELARVGDVQRRGIPARISKRSLVAAIERRRADEPDEHMLAPHDGWREAALAWREAGELRSKVALLEERTGRYDDLERNSQKLREERAAFTQMSWRQFRRWRKAQQQAESL